MKHCFVNKIRKFKLYAYVLKLNFILWIVKIDTKNEIYKQYIRKHAIKHLFLCFVKD